MCFSLTVFALLLRLPLCVRSQKDVIVEAGDFSLLVYSPSTAAWTFNSNPRPGPNGTSVQDYYHGDGSYTTKVNGASVSMTFTGSYVAYYSDLFNTHGNVQITLDGDESIVSAYSPLPYGTPQVKLFEAQVNPHAAHHTIKATNLDDKTAGLDYFRFTPVSEFLSRGSSPSQSSSGPAKATPPSRPQAPSDPGPKETSASAADIPTSPGIQAPSETAEAAPASPDQSLALVNADLSPPTHTIAQEDHDSESSSAPSESETMISKTDSVTSTLSKQPPVPVTPGGPSPQSRSSTIGIIVGIVSALALLALAVACLFWCFHRKRLARRRATALEAEGESDKDQASQTGATVPYLLHSSPPSSVVVEKDVPICLGKDLGASTRPAWSVPLDRSPLTLGTSADTDNASVRTGDLGAPPLYAERERNV